MKSITRNFALIVCLGILVSWQSCGIPEAIFKLTDSIEVAATAIDEAIIGARDAADGATNTFTAASFNFLEELEKLDEKIFGEAKEIIGNDLRQLIDNSIANTGVEFRCNIDFLGNRFTQKLELLKQKLLGGTPILIEPRICSVVPASIDMNVSPNSRNKVTISGYDLHDGSGLTIHLIGNNVSQDVTKYFSSTSTYQGVLNLGASGIPVSKNSQKVVVRFMDQTLSEIPVIQPHTKICETETVEVAISPITVRPDKYDQISGTGAPTLKAINFDFNRICELRWLRSKSPSIVVDVQLSHDKRKVYATTTMRFSGGKYAKINKAILPLIVSTTKRIKSTLYTAPGDKVITRLLSSAKTDKLVYKDYDTSRDQFAGSTGLVQSFIVDGKDKYKSCDVGGSTQATVRFNNLKIELRDKGDCVVSP